MVIALWLFWRAHVDLGLNWSITLEMRKIMNWSCTGFIDASGIRCMPRFFCLPSPRVLVAKLARGWQAWSRLRFCI